MSSVKGGYRPFPAYLDGGREDGGWKGIDEKEILNKRNYGPVKLGNLEQDARRACGDLLGSDVERASYPTGKKTRSIRLYLDGGRSVIATRRETPARAELEVRVLEELGARGAPVPKVLAFDGRFLFQEDLGNKRLSKAIKNASRSEGEQLLDSALTSLAETHATAKEASLERHVVTLGEQEDWRRSLITHTKDLGKFLGLPAPDLPVEKLVKRLRVSKPQFIKWDSRPPNAAVLNDGKVAWFDWEHCGRRNRLDDLVWLLGDQTVPDWPDVEERLLECHLPAFLDDMGLDDARDYLAVYGTLHMCIRLGKIVNKHNREGLGDWGSVFGGGKVAQYEMADARKLSIRASRWAAKSPHTAGLSSWLLEMEELFPVEVPNSPKTEVNSSDAGINSFIKVHRNSKRSLGEGVVDLSGSRFELVSAYILHGCNIHHSASVFCQEVDLGNLAGCSNGQAGPDFAPRFIDRFFGLGVHPSQGEPCAAFLNRLQSAGGAPFVEILFQAILAVENAMAFVLHRLRPIAFSKIVTQPSSKRALMVWSYNEPEVSRRAAKVAIDGLNELLPEEMRRRVDTEDVGFEAAYLSLKAYAHLRRLDYNTSIVVGAAEDRGIPWERIEGRITRLGQGKFQHSIHNAETENTSFIAQRLARDKGVTNRLLADLRIPVPRQAQPANIKEALRAAEDIGYPLVVKPLDGNSGKGVCAGLKGPSEISSAFKRASKFGSRVVVESFITGQDHRLLVVGDRMVAATKRVPPLVTGDGRRTIGELIEELNADPRRDGFTLVQVALDDELNRLLDQAGYRYDSILGMGETFALRSMANYHAGGTTTDVTDRVHPDNQAMAIRAAGAIGMDVAGVDFLITDISRSYKEAGGAIVEINSRPGLDLHTWPAEGEPRDVAGAVIETMLPPGDQGRVPVALIVGAQRSAPVARVLEHILRSSGMMVGLVTGKGAFVDGEPTGPEGAQRWRATQSVLRDPRVEALVCTGSPRQIVKRGLLHNACEVAAIMDTTSDEDIEETRKGLEVVVRATRGKLVVGAQDKLGLEAVQDIDPGRLVLVSRGAGNAAVRRHLETGGQAVVTARDNGEQVIVVLDGDTTVASIPVKNIQTLAGGSSRDRLNEHLFAVALAWGMGVSGEEIVSSLTNDFDADAPVTAPVKNDRHLTPHSRVPA